jgi:methionyl-tRNA formyltransferase
MRILFAGTPALAIPSLSAAARSHEVAAVLSAPDSAAGRGRASAPSAVAQAAAAMGIRVLAPAALDQELIREVRSLGAQLLVVAAYGKIFKPEFLSLFPLGGINLHPSLLPRFRGPSPISAAILAGDAETGVSIQKIAPKFDTGDILDQRTHPLRGDETTETLTDALAALGAELLGSVLLSYEKGEPPAGAAQDESKATYCRNLTKEDGIVSWSDPADLIERKIRAFDPWPRMATTLQGQSLLLLQSRVYAGTLGGTTGTDQPGTVIGTDREHGLLVRAGFGVLAVQRLQLQFKKPLDWRAFLNGNPRIVGARLGQG